MARKRKKKKPGAPPSLAGVLPRGMIVAPWVGPDDEVVLVVTTSRGRKMAEVVVPWGANRLDVEAELLRQLDAEDPEDPLHLV